MQVFSPGTASPSVSTAGFSPLQHLGATVQKASGFVKAGFETVTAPLQKQFSALWRGAPALRMLPAMAASTALFLTACDDGSSGGGNSGNSGGSTRPPVHPTVYIDVDDIGFNPTESWAEPGARVVISNDFACDDLNYDNWCDFDEELEIDVEGRTSSDSYGSDYFDTGYIGYGNGVSVYLPTSLWSGDAYFLDAWYRYSSDWADAGHATAWLNIE